MLVLQRKPGQSFRIGNEGQVIVKVLGYLNGNVRIDIEAPKDMLINREEIHKKVMDKKNATIDAELAEALHKENLSDEPELTVALYQAELSDPLVDNKKSEVV